MIAMIFEVWPKPEHKQDYLDKAAKLRPLVEEIDGFISIERFESLTEPGKLLSLGFFRDEAAVQQWRNSQSHRAAQSIGRLEFFDHYRLRLGTVSRDYGKNDRNQAPADSVALHG